MKRIDLKRTLYNEFVAGQTIADGVLILCGLLLQVVTYWITGDSLLSLITGMLGVFSVTLCSQRRVSSFLFGIFQITCYMVLAARQHFFGELVENGFYLLTTLAGIYTWTRNYDAGDDGNSVQARRLSVRGWAVTLLFFLLGVAGGYWLLRRTSDPARHGQLRPRLCGTGADDVALPRAMDILDCGGPYQGGHVGGAGRLVHGGSVLLLGGGLYLRTQEMEIVYINK